MSLYLVELPSVIVGYHEVEVDMDYQQRLKEKYREAGIMKYHRPLPLHVRCPKRRLCWGPGRVINERVPEYPCVIFPHIGQYYDGGLLAVGISNRANEDLIEEEEIKSESEWIHRRAEDIRYQGSTSIAVYQCLAVYASILLARTGLFRQNVKNISDKRSLLADAIENQIAWTQAVKCNPDTETNKPYRSMWETCPVYILQHEISVLRPRYMLVLGLKTFDYVKRLLIGMGYESEPVGRSTKRPRIERWLATPKKGSQIGVIGVPHPSHSRYEPKDGYGRNEIEIIRQRLKYLKLPIIT